jgi:transcriptional regulator with XRE-family HTH domain
MSDSGVPLRPGRLEELRAGRNWRQKHVADAIGVNLKSYSNWVAGKPVKFEHVAALAELYGVTAESLIAEGHVPPEPIQTTDERLDMIHALLRDQPEITEAGFVEFRQHVETMNRKLDMLLAHFGLDDALDDPLRDLPLPSDPGARRDERGEGSPQAPAGLRKTG